MTYSSVKYQNLHSDLMALLSWLHFRMCMIYFSLLVFLVGLAFRYEKTLALALHILKIHSATALGPTPNNYHWATASDKMHNLDSVKDVSAAHTGETEEI